MLSRTTFNINSFETPSNICFVKMLEKMYGFGRPLSVIEEEEEDRNSDIIDCVLQQAQGCLEEEVQNNQNPPSLPTEDESLLEQKTNELSEKN